MNGIIDDQTSGNDWTPRRRMLHEGMAQPVSANPSPHIQHAVLESLEQQMDQAETELHRMLEELARTFVFSDREDVKTFLRSNRGIPSILIESTPHFRRAFSNVPLVLDVATEEGAPRTIYVLAQWKGERAQAKRSLREFDEHWWLDNLAKAGGKIVFDYELVP